MSPESLRIHIAKLFLRLRRSAPLLFVVVAIALEAQSVQAATAISPANGATVSSTPGFQFDFLYGTANIELSKQPDVTTAGDDVGSFVDPERTRFLSLSSDAVNGLASWPNESPLIAGRYYWHIKTRDDGSELGVGVQGPWQPTMTLTVRDEPIVFEGWTLTAHRIRATRTCKTLVGIYGKFKFSDNVDALKLSARYSIALKASNKVVGRITGSTDWGEGYSGVICTKATKFTASPTLRDPAGHVTPGTAKAVRVH